MKVRDLIEGLQKLDQDAEVFARVDTITIDEEASFQTPIPVHGLSSVEEVRPLGDWTDYRGLKGYRRRVVLELDSELNLKEVDS